MFEELPVREIEKDTYELLSSPGLVLNLPRGDIFRIKDKHAHPEVLKRGGNFCIHIHADELPSEDITSLENDVAKQLNGTLDGAFKGNLTLAVPARNGMDKLLTFSTPFAKKQAFNGTSRTFIRILMTMKTKCF
ncbi:DUF4265 domain-containing protein [Pectobacterium parvum]|nr:DUF4265 domain-containing protein [Pectobacterium parvum]UFK39060.1 DUF4265 domain-containing protein [Pectobacterium parvum]